MRMSRDGIIVGGGSLYCPYFNVIGSKESPQSLSDPDQECDGEFDLWRQYPRRK